MTTPHDSPALFRLESTITDSLEQEARNSGFESKQETVAVTVFFKAGRDKSETFLKSELNFCTVSVDCCKVYLHCTYHNYLYRTHYRAALIYQLKFP